MSSEWAMLPLEDCLDALIDYRGKTPEKTDSGIPLITAKIIKAGRIETPTEFIAVENYEAWMRRGIPQDGDVVLTVEAPLGEVAQLGSEKVALAQRVVTLRGKAGLLDSTYLLYLLQCDETQEKLRSRATGTTVLGIKQSELRKIPINFPPIRQQREVVSILKALDDRITLLRETNQTLEAIAQALFKSWFVDFDPVRAKSEGRVPEGMDEATAALFPDSFEMSELGEIPRGWRVGDLGEIGKISNKKIHPGEFRSEIKYVGLEHMPRKSLSLSEWGSSEGLESSKAVFHQGSILFGKLRPYFHKVVIAPFDGVCSTDILVCQSKDPGNSGILTLHLFSDELINFADRLSNGAKMPRVSWADVASYKIVIPPIDISIIFSRSIQPLFDAILSNIHRSRTLQELRDSLLPRLISGQLRLPDAEAEIEAPTT